MPRLLGDFNNDGLVDATDGAAIITYLSQVSMCHEPSPARTEEDIEAGDVMRNGELSVQDKWAIGKSYAVMSTDNRVYPKSQPANWTDTGADGYKKYWYINDQGQEVSLANEPSAPTFVSKKYFYKITGVGDLLGDDPVAALVTHLP